ncbi:MAG: helix-turn-helix domain-containing protein [Candidatus Merdivicinus sp.]|jgi:AraC-like DNA-binding protein
MKTQMSFINLYPCDPGFSTAERFFKYDYLLYVHEGRGIFKIDGIPYSAAMGDLFYCPPGMGNLIRADEQDPFLLSGIECIVPEFRDLIPRKASLLQHRYLIDTVREMVREYRLGKTGCGEICNALLYALLQNLARMRDCPSPGRDPAEEILEYLTENFSRMVTHEELSDIFRYHKNTINRMLIRKTGLSLKNYLIVLRLRKAKELLQYSNKSVGEIAEYCGYGSAVFFARQFREKTGQTPSEFRRSAVGKRELFVENTITSEY